MSFFISILLGYLFFYGIFKLGILSARRELKKKSLTEEENFIDTFDQASTQMYGNSNISTLIKNYLSENENMISRIPEGSNFKRYIKLKLKKSENDRPNNL